MPRKKSSPQTLPRSSARKKLSVKDLISIQFLTPEDIGLIFETAAAIKKEPRKFARALEGKIVALLFEKPSLRTRVTFDVGMTSMGGKGQVQLCG
jgi:ornithine carbamoyltransferase